MLLYSENDDPEAQLTPTPAFLPLPFLQPREIKDIKGFLHAARRKDARSVKVLGNSHARGRAVRASPLQRLFS